MIVSKCVGSTMSQDGSSNQTTDCLAAAVANLFPTRSPANNVTAVLGLHVDKSAGEDIPKKADY